MTLSQKKMLNNFGQNTPRIFFTNHICQESPLSSYLFNVCWKNFSHSPLLPLSLPSRHSLSTILLETLKIPPLSFLLPLLLSLPLPFLPLSPCYPRTPLSLSPPLLTTATPPSSKLAMSNFFFFDFSYHSSSLFFFSFVFVCNCFSTTRFERANI